MRSGTRISLRNGEVYYTADRVDDVVAKRTEARRTGEMVKLESTAIPTGQMFYLDPYEIATIRRED
jgi:uncharacterized protein YlzI (FlbEa/FlbD family)